MKIEREKAIAMLSTCHFCGEPVEVRLPPHMKGHACTCWNCGSEGGLNIRSDGSTYAYWRKILSMDSTMPN